MFKNSLGISINKRVQQGSNPSIPSEPLVAPEFDTVDFDDADFETGETT